MEPERSRVGARHKRPRRLSGGTRRLEREQRQQGRGDRDREPH